MPRKRGVRSVVTLALLAVVVVMVQPASNLETTDGPTNEPPSVITPEPPQPTEKERFTRTKESLEDIEDTLVNFETELSDAGVTKPLPQPAAVWAVVRQDKDTKEITNSNTFDDICLSDPSDNCLDLVGCLKQINKLTQQFSLDPSYWTNDNLYDLEAENVLLTTIINKDSLKDEIVVTNFKIVFNEMQTVLDEGISVATNEISRLNKEETDTVVFVAAFGSLAGLLIVALIVALSVVAYKSSAIKKSKRQTPVMKSDGNIPLEPTQTSDPPKESRPADPYSKPEPQSTNRYNQPSARPADSRLGSRPGNLYSHPPDPQPPSRSSSDLYSRPHAPKSDRYYTADQVTGTDRYGNRNQGGGLPRIY